MREGGECAYEEERANGGEEGNPERIPAHHDSGLSFLFVYRFATTMCELEACAVGEECDALECGGGAKPFLYYTRLLLTRLLDSPRR